jgi:hypothetical protein
MNLSIEESSKLSLNPIVNNIVHIKQNI